MRPAGHGRFRSSSNPMLISLLMALPGHVIFKFSTYPMLLALVMWPANAWEIQFFYKSHALLTPDVAGQCMGDLIFLQIPCSLRSLCGRPGHGRFRSSSNPMLISLLMALPGHVIFNFSTYPMLLALVMWPAGAWNIQIISKSHAHRSTDVVPSK